MIDRVIKEKEAALAQIQAIQYENVGLQGEIRAKDHQIERCENRIQDLIANRYVPRSGQIDTVLVVVEKNCNEEQHPYYMVRCQKRALKSPT